MAITLFLIPKRESHVANNEVQTCTFNGARFCCVWGYLIMARPGPAPKDPSQLARPKPDAVVGIDGWTEIEPGPNDGEIPPIPEWVEPSPRAEAIYQYLMSLPQARLYGPGTIWELWLALPLIEKYLSKPGVESFKGLVTALGTALRLTEDDMAKGRVKIKAITEDDDDSPRPMDPKVSRLADRRKRLGDK